MTKDEAMEAGLVRPEGSQDDGHGGLYQKCDGCQCVVFWRLKTYCGREVGSLCDWCMTERGWKRMRGSRPLCTEGGE